MRVFKVERTHLYLFRMFNDDDDDEKSEVHVSESEFVDWIEPPLQLCNTSFLQPYMLDRLYDAFHVFQTDPSVQVLCFDAVLRSMVSETIN